MKRIRNTFLNFTLQNLQNVNELSNIKVRSYKCCKNVLVYVLYHPKTIFVIKAVLFTVLIFFYMHAPHAHAGGNDVADGAADDLIATEKGTGIKIAYAVEFVVAVGAAIFKRSMSAFLWIFGIAVFSTFVFSHFLSS